jgi:transposase
MSESKRKIFTGAQKAKVALAAVKGVKTINEIAQEYGVHPTQVNQWRRRVACSKASGPKPVNAQSDPDRLYAKIGQLNMELDWLKKKSGLNP